MCRPSVDVRFYRVLCQTTVVVRSRTTQLCTDSSILPRIRLEPLLSAHRQQSWRWVISLSRSFLCHSHFVCLIIRAAEASLHRRHATTEHNLSTCTPTESSGYYIGAPVRGPVNGDSRSRIDKIFHVFRVMCECVCWLKRQRVFLDVLCLCPAYPPNAISLVADFSVPFIIVFFFFFFSTTRTSNKTLQNAMAVR